MLPLFSLCLLFIGQGLLPSKLVELSLIYVKEFLPYLRLFFE